MSQQYDKESSEMEDIPLIGGRTAVFRRGDTVHRETGPWAPAVHSLLRHLERVGYARAPRVVGSGFDAQGRETLTYIEGKVLHPKPWGEDAMAQIGLMLRELHRATASFSAPADAIWRPWFGRQLGTHNAIGHCDAAPWNIVSADGNPVALIDWEVGGPVDFIFDLAQACWLNAMLYDDDVAELHHLPSPKVRARFLRAILDGYELPRSLRVGFVDKMIEFAVHDAAEQVIETNVTQGTKDPTPLWAITWRTRSAAWMLHHRSMLQRTLG